MVSFRSFKVCLVVLCLLWAVPALAGVRLSEVGRWGGSTAGITVGSVSVQDGTAYAVCRTGSDFRLYVLDVTTPSDIKIIGSCIVGGSNHVKVVGTKAYVAASSTGLQIVDVQNPAAPVLLGTCDTPGYALHTELFGSYACVSDATSGIQIVDVSDPASPVRVGGYATNSYAYASVVFGSCGYVADSPGRLRVIDVSVPASPTLVTTVSTKYTLYSSDPCSLDRVGNYLYLPNYCEILDLANPRSPVSVGSWRTGYSGDGIAVSGAVAYLKATYYGIIAMDVSDVTAPKPVGSYPVSGNVRTLALSDNKLYTVNLDGVMLVLSPTPTSDCAVYGFVKDSAGVPVGGVKVTTSPGNLQATTDTTGQYVICDVPMGLATLTSSAANWTPASVTVENTDGATKRADITLQCGSIAGVVVDDTGAPVSGASVSAYTLTNVVTDSAGRYELSNARGGNNYLVSITKPGCVPQTKMITGLGGQTVTWNAVMPRYGSVKGIVRDNLGYPISGIRVSARVTGESTYYENTTDSSGRYEVVNIPPKTYTVTAYDPPNLWGLKSTSGVVIAPAQASVCDYVFNRGAITGKTVLRNGAPVASATVTLTPGGQTALTADDGSYSFTDVVPKDSYAVTVAGDKLFDPSSGNLSASAKVTGGNTTTTNLTVAKLGSVAGVVCDKLGRRAAGAAVKASYQCWNFTTTTDSLGAFWVPDVRPDYAFGAYRPLMLSVTNAGYTEARKDVYIADGEDATCNVTMTTPTGMVLVNSYAPVTSALDIEYRDGLVYIAAGGFGLVIVNVSDPANLTTVGVCNTPGNARRVALQGNYAYIADDTAGLQIIDISNPASPRIVGSYGMPGSAQGIDVAGRYAYVADGTSGLQIIDVFNPAHPVWVSTFTNQSPDVRAVDVRGGMAYLTADGAKLSVVDVSNPGSPVLLAKTADLVTGGYSAIAVVVSGNTAYVGLSSTYVCTVDISSPGSPKPATILNLAQTNYYQPDLAAYGNRVFAVYGDMFCFEASVPSTLSLTATLLRQGNYSLTSVTATAGFVYQTTADGVLRVYRITDPEILSVTPTMAVKPSDNLLLELSGINMDPGSTVRLTRGDQPDVMATDVAGSGGEYLSCRADMSGAAPGYWNVSVTGPEGKTFSMQRAIALLHAPSAGVLGASMACINDPIMTNAGGLGKFAFWGRAILKDANTFTVDDGCGRTVTVVAPGFSGIADGDYVRAEGTLDALAEPKTLISSPSAIRKLR